MTALEKSVKLVTKSTTICPNLNENYNLSFDCIVCNLGSNQMFFQGSLYKYCVCDETHFQTAANPLFCDT